MLNVLTVDGLNFATLSRNLSGMELLCVKGVNGWELARVYSHEYARAAAHQEKGLSVEQQADETALTRRIYIDAVAAAAAGVQQAAPPYSLYFRQNNKLFMCAAQSITPNKRLAKKRRPRLRERSLKFNY